MPPARSNPATSPSRSRRPERDRSLNPNSFRRVPDLASRLPNFRCLPCALAATGLRDWLQRIIGSRSDAKPGAASSHPVAQPAKARPGKDVVIVYAVNLSGFVIDQPDAMAFYQATCANHPSQFVTYDDLRKQGDLLDKDALKALGLRAHVKLSAQFPATLNEGGAPIHSAQPASSALPYQTPSARCTTLATWKRLA